MSKFINPWVDRGFKILFGQEINKDLLIDFLNDLFDGERCITDLTFLNVELPSESIEGRGAIFDLKCKDAEGSVFIVEVQNASQCYFYERGLYYLCRAICEQGQRGSEWKFGLYPVYGIFLLNFKSGRTGKLRTDIILADRYSGKQFSDKMRQIYLEMPFFTKEEDECETPFEMWLYVLKNMDKLERMPFKAQKQLFEKLEKMAGIANLTKEERLEYDEALKVYRDCKNIVDYANVEGRAAGHAEGRAEGIVEGREEEKIAIAKSFKEKGTPVKLIAECTGLSEEEINNL